MVTAPELLAQLSSLGFRVSLTEEVQLKTTGPKGSMPEELQEAIRSHRSDLVDLIRVQAATEEALKLFPGSRVIQEPTTQEDIHWDKDAAPFSGHGKRVCGYANHADRVWFRIDGEPACGICHPPPEGVK